MKRSILALILAILLCLPLLASCNKKNEEQPTENTPTEEITDKPAEKPTEKPTDSEGESENKNENQEEQAPTPEPEKFVMDYTVSKRVYSYYTSEYGIIGTALNKYGMPLSIDVYGDDLVPSVSYSFCKMQYDEGGKLTSLSFPRSSIMQEELFGSNKDVTFEIIRHDKTNRPLKTSPVDLATISFEYDDDASTYSIIFTHVYRVGSYTLTFDENSRLLLVDDFGYWNKNEYTDSAAIHTEKDFENGEKYELSYSAYAPIKLITSDISYTYTYNEAGLCSSVDATDPNGNTSRQSITYDQKNRMSKLESFTLDGENTVKLHELTWAYDLYDKITEHKKLLPAENGELRLEINEQYAYTAEGFLEAKTFTSYDESNFKSFESVISYKDDGSYVQSSTTYDSYRIVISETAQYDTLGRPTHVFSSWFDVNNSETESENTVYEYSDTEGEYTKITIKYSYSICRSQTTEKYLSDVLREKEIISYDENMNVTDIVITYYDKDGNEIV